MDSINSDSFRNDPVLVSSLPKVEELEYTSLSPKLLTKKNISTTLSFLVFIGLAFGGRTFIPEVYKSYFPTILIFIVLLFIWRYIVNFQWQWRSGYALRERDILFKRGFLSERTTAVPFNRIQHVSTSRGILDKALGLSNLQVFTAGGSGSDISVPGLTPERASSLKENLSQRIAGHA